VLVVDDEVALAKMTGKVLRGLGYDVDTVHSAAEAIDCVRERPGRYDAVLSDFKMPGMNGGALAVALLKIRPDLPVVICTGFSESMTGGRAREIGVRAVLLKPLESALLARVLREVLQAPATG
jgi:CheY-like chemotaxis protein